MNKLILAKHLFDGVDGNLRQDHAVHIVDSHIKAVFLEGTQVA